MSVRVSYAPASHAPGSSCAPTPPKKFLKKPSNPRLTPSSLTLKTAAPEEKDAAREQVVRMLNSGVVAWVRINAITTEHWWKDVKALKNVKGLRGVMLATAEHATDIDRTAAELPPEPPSSR